MFSSLLELDTSLLITARGVVGPEHAKLIQIAGESIVIWGGLILLWIWLSGLLQKDTTKKIIALRIFFIIILVFLIYGVINLMIPQWRPSPASVVGGIAPLIPHPIDNSFPSGHALFTAALLVGIWKWNKSTFLITLTSIIGLITLSARVIGGVHYPGDILGGLFFGTIGALLLMPVVTSTFMEKVIYPFLIRVAGWLKL